jgi:hypothetical protein
MQKKIEKGCEDESVERVRMAKRNLFPGWNFAAQETEQKLNIAVVKNPAYCIFLGSGEAESTWYVGHYLAYHASPDDKCGGVGGMTIGRGNRSTRRKPAPMPLRPPQIPHNVTWNRTQPSVVGSRRQTAWAMARPCVLHLEVVFRPVTWATWVCTNKNHAVQFLHLRRHCFVIKMEPVPSGTWKNLSRDLSPLREQYGPCHHQSSLHASTL